MAKEQYVATDKETGFEVAVTGEFPPHPEDRMRIARTTTLFTRLMSTLLRKEESERRTGFRAVETQLELADALIRQDMDDVRRLVRETMESMGVTQEQLDDLARQIRDLSGLDEATAEQISQAFGLDPAGRDPTPEETPESGSDADDSVVNLPPPASSYAPPDEAPESSPGDPAAAEDDIDQAADSEQADEGDEPRSSA